ncbi:MAG: hypothetical protein Q9182_000474 [Xanthomendoza sp. 2 TL-2023]
MLVLDKDTPIRVQYHAEGAANVVFIVASSRSSDSEDDDYGIVGTTTHDGIPRIDIRLKGKLLRLRKDVPSVTPIVDSHRHFEEHIAPLFPSNSLVEQIVCKVTPDFVRKCNAALCLEEEPLMKRPTKRHGVNLSETEAHGILITDMRYDKTHASTEFKPKWLAQSPTAPPGSKRCRTCALRAMRDVKHNTKPPSLGKEPGDFCPLTLVSDNQDVIHPSFEPLLVKSSRAPIDVNAFRDQTISFFRKTPLLRLLRDLQIKKDPKGILKVDPSNVDFMTAMALRDCTVFLKIPNQDEAPGALIEARLGDLDLKTPDGGKSEYWRETEKQLIEEGCLESIVRMLLPHHTRATSTTTSNVCQSTGDLIQNGGFETVVNGGPRPWEFALPVGTGSGQNAAGSLVIGGSAACCSGNYASLRIPNSAGGGYGETYVTQSIPALCPGVSYTLTYNEQITVNQGGTSLGCLVEIGLDDRNLVFERLTSDVSPRTITQTFTYSGTKSVQGLTFRFSCEAPYGLMLIDSVSLVAKLGPRIKS